MERLTEHEKGAKLLDETSLQSKFYRSYPSKDVQIDVSKCRLGDFEDLVAYCGIGFDGSNSESVEKLLDLFDWGDARMQQHLSRLKWRNFPETKKKMCMLAYLFELVYDLCVAPSHNISRSPGFEVPLGALPK